LYTPHNRERRVLPPVHGVVVVMAVSTTFHFKHVADFPIRYADGRNGLVDVNGSWMRDPAGGFRRDPALADPVQPEAIP
jgi:hypothetical protein